MKNQIDFLEIENFKSIKNLKFDCKRVNVFVGKPNVGKSNILEALGLYSINYEKNNEKFLSSFTRYKFIKNLFYDQNTKTPIRINSNLGIASLRHLAGNANLFYMTIFDRIIQSTAENATGEYIEDLVIGNSIQQLSQSFSNTLNSYRNFYVENYLSDDENGHDIKFNLDSSFYSFDNEGKCSNLPFISYSQVKKYNFSKRDTFKNLFESFLMPPDGDNLFTIIQNDKDLFKEIQSFFEDYKLQLVLKINESEFEVLKNIDGLGYSYPYVSIADTLQRIIFYLAAIDSNKESVLVFEEPEANAYPAYTQLLADRICQDTINQYFVTTHSPYLLNRIIEKTPFENLCVYLVEYENYETKVKLLPDQKLRELLNFGFDVFSQFRFLTEEHAT